MLGVISTIASFGLAFGVSWFAYQQGGLFAWHPICMVFGALYASTASINAVRMRHKAAGLTEKTRLVQFHSVVNNLAVMSMLIGAGVIYTNKERNDKPHLTSRHAWVGVVTLALCLCNMAIAMLNTVDLEHKRLRFLWSSRNHRWLGMASYLAGLAAVCLGFHSVWGVQSLGGMQGAWVLTSGVALVFLGISSESMRDLVGKRSKAVGQHQKAA